jgi:hypothetical protein
MIRYAQGNLLAAPVEALVNTVNEVGVMGKGIALMFHEAFPEAARAYERSAKAGLVHVGQMFVTENRDLLDARSQQRPRPSPVSSSWSSLLLTIIRMSPSERVLRN